MKLSIFILLIFCLTLGSTVKPTDCTYNEMVELQEECGDHFELFFHRFPVEVLDSKDSFQRYEQDNQREFESIINNSYHTMRIGFFYDVFDASYMGTIKKELDDVIACQSE